jgi:predicted nucleic acid-binding protein
MSPPGPVPDFIVADTDAVSFVVKQDPVRGPRYARHFAGRNVVLPFAVVAELRLWAEVRNWGPQRRAALAYTLQGCLIHYPDAQMCTLWASLVAALRRAGRQIAVHDAWVATTALHLSVALVTHNAAHYRNVPGQQVLTEPDRSTP